MLEWKNINCASVTTVMKFISVHKSMFLGGNFTYVKYSFDIFKLHSICNKIIFLL